MHSLRHTFHTLDSPWSEDRADIEVPRPRGRRDDIAAVRAFPEGEETGHDAQSPDRN
jgi:hypothetical protein